MFWRDAVFDKKRDMAAQPCHDAAVCLGFEAFKWLSRSLLCSFCAGVPCPLETKLAQAGWAPEFIQIHVASSE